MPSLAQLMAAVGLRKTAGGAAEGPVRLGWYGKVPGAEDFVAGGYPSPALSAARDWATAAMTARDKAGEDAGGTAFLTAPIWRVAATGGVFGPTGCLGLLAPGADRIGRRFPILLIGAMEIDDPNAALRGARDWLIRAEGAVRALMHPDADPRRLGDLPPPAQVDLAGRPPGARLLAETPSRPALTHTGPADGALFATLFGEVPA